MSNSHSPYQSSQTTHTTVSSLSAPGEGIIDMAGDCEEGSLVDIMKMDTPLPPLKSVFDCPKIELCIVNGKNGWRCVWCSHSFTPAHATRALAHAC